MGGVDPLASAGGIEVGVTEPQVQGEDVIINNNSKIHSVSFPSVIFIISYYIVAITKII